MSNQTKYNKKREVIENFILLSSIFFFLSAAIWLFKGQNPLSCDNSIDYNAFGTFGDYIGGVLGTIAAIVAAYFVYITYKSQMTTFRKQQIENHFYELLKLHEANVAKLKSDTSNIFTVYINNVKIFVDGIKEYNEQEGKQWNSYDIVIISYLFFFLGINNEFVKTEIRNSSNSIEMKDIDEINQYLVDKGIKYNGAYTELGIYFRQLFQIVTYIDDKKELSYLEKYEYIKTLRVRLNIEEQYLLFLNSLCATGRNWELMARDEAPLEQLQDKKEEIENRYFVTKYNLLKNIPPHYSLIDIIKVEDIYSDVDYEYGNESRNERKRLIEIFSKYSKGQE